MLKINEDRLWGRLMEIAKIGATPKGGVCRVTLTEEDKAGRLLFMNWCQEIGCSIRTDAIGNIFARFQGGAKPGSKAIIIGSHLDSQPTGGKYDGVMGVIAGLELCHTLYENNVPLKYPIEIVSWTNEEGARFDPAMMGSAVFSGQMNLEEAYAKEDKKGVSVKDALHQIEARGNDQVSVQEFIASLEFHIEQGPVLEKTETTIGVVTGVQGIRWYDVKISGKECHAGPTPMSYRVDPVQQLPPLLQSIYGLCDAHGEESKVTIGYLDCAPGVKNTVPGEILVSVDLRHPDEEVLTQMHKDLHALVKAQNDSYQGQIEVKDVWHSPVVKFNQQCIDAISEAVTDLGISHCKMVSGAGHDSVNLSKVIPTSMVFIPCKDGLSHNELESAKKEHVSAGANVLLQAALRLQKT